MGISKHIAVVLALFFLTFNTAHAIPPLAKMGHDKPPAKSQTVYIRSELTHMGWLCHDGVVTDWQCISPDQKYVIGGYHVEGDSTLNKETEK